MCSCASLVCRKVIEPKLDMSDCLLWSTHCTIVNSSTTIFCQAGQIEHSPCYSHIEVGCLCSLQHYLKCIKWTPYYASYAEVIVSLLRLRLCNMAHLVMSQAYYIHCLQSFLLFRLHTQKECMSKTLHIACQRLLTLLHMFSSYTNQCMLSQDNYISLSLGRHKGRGGFPNNIK